MSSDIQVYRSLFCIFCVIFVGACTKFEPVDQLEFYDAAISEISFCLQSGKRCAAYKEQNNSSGIGTAPTTNIPTYDKRSECFESIDSTKLVIKEKTAELRIECFIEERRLFLIAVGQKGTASQDIGYPVVSISRRPFPDSMTATNH